MNRAAKIVVASAVTTLLATGGIGAYNLLRELTSVDAGTGSAFDPASISKTPPSSGKAEELAKAFLGDWSQQHLEAAGGDTDDPISASQALKDYASGLHLKKLSFTHIRSSGPSSATRGATKVDFDVTAQVNGGTWHYASAVAVRQSSNGAPAVRWNSSVLYPGLQKYQSLTAGQLPPGTGDSTVVASDGKTDLSAYPSLKDIIATIRQNAPAKGGTPGTGVAVVDGDGAGVAAAQVFHKGKTPAIRTTIDAHLQEIAEHAVKDAHLQDKPAGTVALDWHTGHILAIAHTGDDGDIAINGIKSPGSTMKIITSAALFDQAGLTTNSPAPCADSLVANSQNFHNDEGVKPAPNATITQAFTVSCNTSFIKDGFHYLVHDGDASALNKEATDVFGMGSWTIGGGVATTDPSIPSDVQGSDQAAQFIGQGKVTATPLFMASVAATVRNTGFEQPIILPGQHQTGTPQRMSARTAGYLQTMMRSVATIGTAAPRLHDLPGVGAKTGTAEEGDHTNGWLTAYDSHIAVAALVEGGTSGVDSAGYVVRKLLTTS
ncbi:penicillin-binding transpeptidase domain-containing protein [Streptomyces sp. NBC_01455]|uniref:penicillin-binding transpeptidase domain-containing protein n=1 Tax=Streptomyces sp. NBC_01455 TaxID=2903874 RepID=UPI002E36FFC3|nr:penicillin-binding transpeptidase domain-containing protein [Streptomyces sp. NBC_01455]